jgi:hypothetical protein
MRRGLTREAAEQDAARRFGAPATVAATFAEGRLPVFARLRSAAARTCRALTLSPRRAVLVSLLLAFIGGAATMLAVFVGYGLIRSFQHVPSGDADLANIDVAVDGAFSAPVQFQGQFDGLRPEQGVGVLEPEAFLRIDGPEGVRLYYNHGDGRFTQVNARALTSDSPESNSRPAASRGTSAANRRRPIDAERGKRSRQRAGSRVGSGAGVSQGRGLNFESSGSRRNDVLV